MDGPGRGVAKMDVRVVDAGTNVVVETFEMEY